MCRSSISFSWIPILILIISVTVSCQTLPSSTSTVEPAPTGPLVFDKEFDNDSDPWCDNASYEFGDFFCQDNELHLAAKGTGNIATLYDGDFKNFVLQTQMRLIGDIGAYGVVFRGNDTPPNFYIFQIRPSGQYQLIKWSQQALVLPDGKYQFVKWSQAQDQNEVLIPWTDSNAINKDQAMNELEVVAQDSFIILFVNSQRLTSITDYSLTHGVAGPVATNQGHVAVSFFKVWELPDYLSLVSYSPNSELHVQHEHIALNKLNKSD